MTLKYTHVIACTVLGSAASLFTTIDAQAGCNPEYSYVGDICITAGTYCPAGTIVAKGQMLPVSQYEELFAVLGTHYGSDGQSKFALPNLVMRAPVGAGEYEPAQFQGGHQATTVGINLGKIRTNQTAAQLAHHTHDATVSDAGMGVGTSNTPTQMKDATKQRQTSPAAPPTVTIAPAGQGADTYIVGPRLTVNYCVIVDGDFPPRFEDAAEKPSE